MRPSSAKLSKATVALVAVLALLALRSVLDLELSAPLADASEEPPLVAFARQRADANNNIILTYASYSYKVPLMNWLASLARLGTIGNVGIVCLDVELADYLASFGETCIKLADMSVAGQRLDLDSVKRLWVLRSEHVVQLLEAGISVALSDSDAIWLRDPFASGLFSPESGDVVAGKGKFPYDQPWGAALCMGVIYIRSCAGAIGLARAALEATRGSNDDQIGYNRALAALPGGGASAFQRKVSAVDNVQAVAVLGQGDLRVKVRLVEHDLIPRECQRVTKDKWANAVHVAHCHVADGVPAATNKNKGNQKSHFDVLVKYNLYFLGANWEVALKDRTGAGQSLLEALHALSSTSPS